MAGMMPTNSRCPWLQSVLLQCLDALCQYSDQVVAHHKAVAGHLLPALAAAVGRPGESRDSRFLCLKLLCDVILHFLLETDLYSAPRQSQSAGPGAGQCPFPSLLLFDPTSYVLHHCRPYVQH